MRSFADLTSIVTANSKIIVSENMWIKYVKLVDDQLQTEDTPETIKISFGAGTANLDNFAGLTMKKLERNKKVKKLILLRLI